MAEPIPDDGTRDIRLPPLPGRPAPAVPPEWSSYVPATPASQFDEPTERVTSSHRTPGRTEAFRPAPRVRPFRVSVTPRRSRTGRLLWALFFLIVAVIVACGIYLVIVVTQR